MKRASISDAKNQLSALLDRVRQGETVIIEDRGVPVACLGPVVGARTAGRDGDRLARLERQGTLRPARATTTPRSLRQGPPRPGRRVSLSRLVLDEREAGW